MENLIYNKVMTGKQLVEELLQVERSCSNIGSVIDNNGISQFPPTIDKNMKYEVHKTETVYTFSPNSYFHYKIKKI